MPQFDKITFLNQILWLFFFFFFVYFLILKFFLTRLAFILKVREKKLSRGAEILENCPIEITKNQIGLNFLWSKNLNKFKEIQLLFKNTFYFWLRSNTVSLLNLNFLEKKIYKYLFISVILRVALDSIQFSNFFNFKFLFLQKIQIQENFKKLS